MPQVQNLKDFISSVKTFGHNNKIFVTCSSILVNFITLFGFSKLWKEQGWVDGTGDEGKNNSRKRKQQQKYENNLFA